MWTVHRAGTPCGESIAEFINSEDRARLIAAAPELLEACKLARRHLLDTHEGLSTAYEACSAAIAKAEGKSNGNET